jgi:hypothetical protein
MKSWISSVTALLLLLLASVPLGAQSRAEMRLIPRLGMLTPADFFYEEYGQFALGSLDWTQAAIQRSLLGGLTAEVAWEERGVWVRAEVLRTWGAETTLRQVVLLPAVGFNPPSLAEVRYQVPTTLTLGSIDLALPTRLRLSGGIQPYITAGLGAKRYAFDDSGLEESTGRLVRPRPGVTPHVNVGAGATVRIRGAVLDLLLRDAVSEYWDRQQHDVMVLVGLAVPLF